MRNDDLDRLLSRDSEIVPSSGFILSVMDAVRSESSVPPLQFPWKLALPGLIATIVVIVLVFSTGFAQLLHNAVDSQSQIAVHPAVLWTASALLLTFVLLILAMRLAGPKA